MESQLIASILETLMIVFFGLSWPINVFKTYSSRTAKGKSILFNYLVTIGYICGIVSKIMYQSFNLAFYFYFPNLIMVILDIVFYYRNKKLDASRDRQ